MTPSGTCYCGQPAHLHRYDRWWCDKCWSIEESASLVLDRKVLDEIAELEAEIGKGFGTGYDPGQRELVVRPLPMVQDFVSRDPAPALQPRHRFKVRKKPKVKRRRR